MVTSLETIGNTKLNNIVSNNYSQWGESCGVNGNIDALNTSNIGIVTIGYHILNNSFQTKCTKLINALNYECSIHLVGCWTLKGYKPSC